VVTADELKDDEEYEDIMEDMRLEAGKYGIYISCLLFLPFQIIKHVWAFLDTLQIYTMCRYIVKEMYLEKPKRHIICNGVSFILLFWLLH